MCVCAEDLFMLVSVSVTVQINSAGRCRTVTRVLIERSLSLVFWQQLTPPQSFLFSSYTGVGSRLTTNASQSLQVTTRKINPTSAIVDNVFQTSPSHQPAPLP